MNSPGTSRRTPPKLLPASPEMVARRYQATGEMAEVQKQPASKARNATLEHMRQALDALLDEVATLPPVQAGEIKSLHRGLIGLRLGSGLHVMATRAQMAGETLRVRVVIDTAQGRFDEHVTLGRHALRVAGFGLLELSDELNMEVQHALRAVAIYAG